MFRYFGDPLFLLCAAAYALNRWYLRPAGVLASPFMHWYFNDLLTVPVALPAALWVERRLRLRAHDGYPRLWEVALHWAVWSVVLEGVGPRFWPGAWSDPWDVAAYAAGGTVAYLWWRVVAGWSLRRNRAQALS